MGNEVIQANFSDGKCSIRPKPYCKDGKCYTSKIKNKSIILNQ